MQYIFGGTSCLLPRELRWFKEFLLGPVTRGGFHKGSPNLGLVLSYDYLCEIHPWKPLVVVKDQSSHLVYLNIRMK